MFRYFRALLAALERLAQAADSLCSVAHDVVTDKYQADGLGERVATLERTLERREAEAEALMLKAKGKFDAARSAEERERRLAASRAEEGDEEGDLTPEEIRAAYEAAGIPLEHVDEREEEGVPPVHSAMGARRDSKVSAHAFKFRRT